MMGENRVSLAKTRNKRWGSPIKGVVKRKSSFAGIRSDVIEGTSWEPGLKY